MKSWKIQRWKKAKERLSEVEVFPWNGRDAQKQEIQNKKVVRRLLGKNFSVFEECNLRRMQCKQKESTEEQEMKQQQRMMIMKDLMKIC